MDRLDLPTYFEALGFEHVPASALPVGVRDHAHPPVCLILTHPLWSEERQNYTQELADVASEYERRGYRVQTRSIFRAARTPWEAVP